MARDWLPQARQYPASRAQEHGTTSRAWEIRKRNWWVRQDRESGS